MAGSYDARSATIRHVEVPGFGRAGLVPEIAAVLGTPIGVDNDVNLAAVAERRRGVGRDADGFALLWLGEEGLGLAIDVGGTLLRGARGGAGEIGYMPLFAPTRTSARSISRTWSAARRSWRWHATTASAAAPRSRRSPAPPPTRSAAGASSSPRWPTGSRWAWPP